jgi:hypothetical protein
MMMMMMMMMMKSEKPKTDAARTKEPGRELSDPSFATCLHPNGPRTFLL